MCSVTAGVAIVGLIVQGATAANEQSKANRRNELQAQIVEKNAATARMEAEWVRDATGRRIKEFKRQTGQTVGAQRVAMGSSGLVVGEGTFEDLTQDTVAMAAQDEDAILFEGDLVAWRAENAARAADFQGVLYRGQSSSVFLTAAPSLIRGAGVGLGAGFKDRGVGTQVGSTAPSFQGGSNLNNNEFGRIA